MAYLVHHGIKGQKWGIRRFQNEDGTLTTAGRKRYGDLIEKFNNLRDVGIKKGPGPNRQYPMGTKKGPEPNAKYPVGTRTVVSNRETKKRMTSEQKKALAKKIAIGAGAATVVAATAYVASKHIKGKTESFLNRNWDLKLKYSIHTKSGLGNLRYGVLSKS